MPASAVGPYPVATAVILAGGIATRLWPVSLATPKGLLPSQSTPLVLSSMNEAVEAGIREVIIVASPEDEALFRKLFSRKAQLESHMAEKGNFRAVSILQDLADKGAPLPDAVPQQPRGPPP